MKKIIILLILLVSNQEIQINAISNQDKLKILLGTLLPGVVLVGTALAIKYKPNIIKNAFESIKSFNQKNPETLNVLEFEQSMKNQFAEQLKEYKSLPIEQQNPKLIDAIEKYIDLVNNTDFSSELSRADQLRLDRAESWINEVRESAQLTPTTNVSVPQNTDLTRPLPDIPENVITSDPNSNINEIDKIPTNELSEPDATEIDSNQPPRIESETGTTNFSEPFTEL